MAKDDYYVIVYQILSYLYQCLKKGEDVNVECLQPESLFGINPRYWLYIFEHLQQDGLIEGFVRKEYINNQVLYELDRVQITPAGIGYLLDNNLLAKAKKFLKEMKELNPFD